jgi:hypothetical protein
MRELIGYNTFAEMDGVKEVYALTYSETDDKVYATTDAGVFAIDKDGTAERLD